MFRHLKRFGYILVMGIEPTNKSSVSVRLVQSPMFGSVQFDSIETVVRVRFGFSISVT